MSETSLKETYRRQLHGFVALNALVFIALFSGEDMIEAVRLGQLGGLVSPKAVLGLVLPFVTLVLDAIVSADTKAVLVYWRLRNPLPGCEAFTKHGPADTRVDMKALERRHGPFPVVAKRQNQLWYQLFKAVENQPSVAQAHRMSLMTRDLASLSVALFSLGAIFGAALRVGMLPWAVLVAVLAVQYLALRQAAVNSGRRFVTTVLAETAASTD